MGHRVAARGDVREGDRAADPAGIGQGLVAHPVAEIAVDQPRIHRRGIAAVGGGAVLRVRIDEADVTGDRAGVVRNALPAP